MKRLLLIVIGLCCLPLIALENDFSKLNSGFFVSDQSSDSIDLKFTLPQYELEAISQEGELYQKIMVKGAGTLTEQGYPELPVLTTTIAIPAQGNVEVEILSARQSIISGIKPYPAQDESLPVSGRVFLQNASFYNGKQEYPSRDLVVSQPMILRDLRIVTVSVSPFVYDAGAQELKVRESIDIRLRFSPEPGVNELMNHDVQISPAFAKIYESMILNWHEYRDLVVANTPPRYLIIHGNTTEPTFLAALNGFATWKRQKGADVDIATTATSSAGTSTSSIQTYIRNRYSNPATRPDYVILIGDTGGSYAIPAFTNNGGGTDYPYSFMNSGDILGDLFVGRISVENINHFLVVLEKIYLYERDIDLDTAQWLNHMLLVGDDNPSGISTMYLSKYIKELAEEVNPENTFTEMYGSNFDSFVTGINAAFNQGISFYSFRGYIDFSPPAEGALNNGYKLPHAVIITCATGNYSGGTAETESLIRYGTTALLKGSVTAVGMSTSSTHTTFNHVLHGGIFEGIYARGMRTMGEAVLHGKLYMHEIFGVSSAVNVEKFSHWCNLMGDPTMEVYTGIPNSFQIQTQSVIPLGLSLLDVSVSDSQDQPVAGASVVLSMGFDILSRGYTDLEGNVILVLPTGMSAGMGEITVAMHDFKPLIHPVTVQNSATLVPSTIIVNDSASGNNNSLITAGETVDLYFGLLNTGSGAVAGVSGYLATESPWVQIIQGQVSYPTIPGGASAQNLSPLVIQIAPNTPHDTMLRLHLMLTNSSGTSYDVSEYIPVESARMEFRSFNVLDNGGGVLDPGETAELKITLQNTGSASAQGVFAELISENDLLEVTDATAFLGNISVNATVSSATNHFQVYSRTPTIPGMVMPLSLRLYNAAGFEQFIPVSLTIGTVNQQSPLGPDSYGYVIYDQTDTAYPEAPVYEWMPIAPQEGGLGTVLPISDIYDAYDEGDQVGAQSLAIVDLPFEFRFYGRYYNQITVCSNGYIALGITGNAEFRNFRLPGAMGPSPMIAAFWDDLATHSGSSISYWFDRSNRRFIVEWYNMLNGKNGTSPETFQIMLYDQNFHYTSLGDGPIKIQYHTFNNVDSQSGNRHGNYATIGIEDHSGTVGLEYTFNNSYPTAATPLGNATAIFITNNPSMYDAPITLSGISDKQIRQGETITITEVEQYFHSVANLDYSVVENPYITSEIGSLGFKINPVEDFFGETQILIRATDPMGRYIDTGFNLSVQKAQWHKQTFTETSLPAGWVTGHLGSTTQTWHIEMDETGNYFAKTSASNGHTANERLSTASFNLSGYRNTRVRFWLDFLPSPGASGTLQYSFNNIVWNNVDSFNSAFMGYKEYHIPGLDNRNSVRLRWAYGAPTNSTGAENHMIIDDICITGVYPALVQNIELTSNEGSLTLSWNPVITDTAGNTMTVSGYRIYASELPDFEPDSSDLMMQSTGSSVTFTSEQLLLPKRFFRVVAKTD